jgi:hypothetical protein
MNARRNLKLMPIPDEWMFYAPRCGADAPAIKSWTRLHPRRRGAMSIWTPLLRQG